MSAFEKRTSRRRVELVVPEAVPRLEELRFNTGVSAGRALDVDVETSERRRVENVEVAASTTSGDRARDIASAKETRSSMNDSLVAHL
jgi:hypothetical protein